MGWYRTSPCLPRASFVMFSSRLGGFFFFTRLPTSCRPFTAPPLVALQAAIRNASSLEEVQQLEEQLKAGVVPEQ